MSADVTETAWLHWAKSAFELYREELLRTVAGKLIRPRQSRTLEELRERMVEALDDPVGIDRALKPISNHARQLLSLIDFSRQPRWQLQSLVDLLPVIGATDGIGPIKELLEAGLMFPVITQKLPIESIDAWLGQAAMTPLSVFTLPLVAERCRNESLTLEAPAGEKLAKAMPVEVDGLEWPIRIAYVWQMVHDNSLRLTQAGGYFKRDLDRLRANAVLAAQPDQTPMPVADPAMLAVEFARHLDNLHLDRDELSAAELPDAWLQSVPRPIESLWPAVWSIRDWDPVEGLANEVRATRFMPGLGLALMAALYSTSASQWHSINFLAEWIAVRQSDFGRDLEKLLAWCQAFLLGFMHSLKAIEATKVGNTWHVRLAQPVREWLTDGKSAIAAAPTLQTLLVQPNLEILLYRQGLTPHLIGQLTRFAEWKQLGLACTLSLTAESVYRGLESGMGLADIVRTLERHGTRTLPDSVLETLRSWSTKRERVQVFSSAMLLEFRTTEELQAALKQGLIEQALTDRVGLVTSESQIDYSRFRLVGTRDYLAPEERCVEVDDDGLTLIVQDGKADLLLSAEVRRFAEMIEPLADDRSRYRMSIDTLQRARRSGIELRWLDEWFFRRTGFAIPSSAKLLFQGADVGSLSVNQITLLRLPSEEVADGIERWPDTEPYIRERLGPTTFSVDATKLAELKRLLANAGLVVESPTY